MTKAVAIATGAVLVLAILFTIALSLHVGDWTDTRLGNLLLTGWAVSPYVAFLVLYLTVCADGGPAAWVGAVGSWLAVAFGVAAFVDGFFIHLDAQNGLLFIFVPLYQWAAFGCVALVTFFAAMRRKGR